MSKVLVDRELLERIVNTNMADYAVIAYQHKEIRGILAQPAEAEVVDLQRLAAEFDAAPDDAEWEPPHPIFQMARDLDRVTAALSAVTAERDRLREEMAELWKRIDKFQSQSHGITALAEIERLRAEVDGLRKAFMKMRNVAAGYSNCCEFDSANTRRLDREFEAADELFRSSAALAAKEA